MHTWLRLGTLATLAAAAAGCNTPSEGAQGQLLFTPINCGNPLLGCDFADGVVEGGLLEVQITGQGGVATAGLDLASTDPTVLAVSPTGDVNGRPTWQLHGAGAGVATLAALDDLGTEIDFVAITVIAPERLGLVNLVGDAVGPTVETGVDEAWTVNAGQLVSFQAVPRAAGNQLIGRLDHVVVLPQGSTLLDTEQSSSDRPGGYLYVQPPTGDYPFTFEVDGSPDVAVDVMLHAR